MPRQAGFVSYRLGRRLFLLTFIAILLGVAIAYSLKSRESARNINRLQIPTVVSGSMLTSKPNISASGTTPIVSVSLDYRIEEMPPCSQNPSFPDLSICHDEQLVQQGASSTIVVIESLRTAVPELVPTEGSITLLDFHLHDKLFLRVYTVADGKGNPDKSRAIYAFDVTTHQLDRLAYRSADVIAEAGSPDWHYVATWISSSSVGGDVQVFDLAANRVVSDYSLSGQETLSDGQAGLDASLAPFDWTSNNSLSYRVYDASNYDGDTYKLVTVNQIKLP